jgi:hypothetical protein
LPDLPGLPAMSKKSFLRGPDGWKIAENANHSPDIGYRLNLKSISTVDNAASQIGGTSRRILMHNA